MLTNFRLLDVGLKFSRRHHFYPLLDLIRMKSEFVVGPDISFHTNSDQLSLSQSELKLIDSKAQQNSNSGTQRPLCYLGGWYDAQLPHLMKFVEFYLDQQFDVLLVQTKISTFKSPAAAKKLDETILKFLQNNLQYSEIIIHGFSSAIFSFARINWIMNQSPKTYNQQQILSRFVGQVWDSPGVRPASGFAHAVVRENRYVRNFVMGSFKIILNIFGGDFNEKVRRANETFENNPLKCPALCFCSENDEIVNHKEFVKMLKLWEQNGINVRIKSWKESAHCTHFRNYPEEYKQELISHLSGVGVTTKL